jgi:aspartate/methionine/tyrosine aminotransferase
MLYEGNVCVLSGTAFGTTCPDHIRISYANSQTNLRRALERIEEVVARTPAATPA